MILRKTLLILLLLIAFSNGQNDQTEGSGNLQAVVSDLGADQEGSGQIYTASDTEVSVTTYGRYLDSDYDTSIHEALLSSDSWKGENTDNDIIFMEEPTEGGEITHLGDDEDYATTVSGNNALEAAEEETNVLGDLDNKFIRTLAHQPSKIKETGEDINIVIVKPTDSELHIDRKALGKTGNKRIAENTVFGKYSRLSAVVLLAAAVGIVALLSCVGLVLTKYRPCAKTLDVP